MRGAQGVYTRVVAPLLRRHRSGIDATLARSSEQLCGGSLGQELQSRLCNIVATAASKAQEELGMDDFLAAELTKAAGAGPGVGPGVRRRAASPRPVPRGDVAASS